MLVGWVNLAISSVVACIVLLGLFLAMFKFYSKLAIYHRPQTAYRGVIAIKGRDSIPRNVRDIATAADLERPPEDEEYVLFSALSENSPPPEIVVDFQENELRCRGENRFEKFKWLWIFSMGSVIVSTGIFVFYSAVFNQLNLDFSLSEGEWIFGIVVLLSILNFVVRVGSFLTFSILEEDVKDRLRLDLHNFMFSFIMSAAVLATIFLFIPIASGRELFADVTVSNSATSIIAAMILVPLVLSALSEIMLHYLEVPESLKSHYTRHRSTFHRE